MCVYWCFGVEIVSYLCTNPKERGAQCNLEQQIWQTIISASRLCAKLNRWSLIYSILPVLWNREMSWFSATVIRNFNVYTVLWKSLPSSAQFSIWPWNLLAITQQFQLCICLIWAACPHYIIKYQLYMMEQSLNITAEASLPQESTTPDLLPGTRAVTAARSSSGLLYLSKSVRNECTCRITKLQRCAIGLAWRMWPFSPSAEF